MSKFIVVEGSEGVGKSTQIKTIKSFLESIKLNILSQESREEHHSVNQSDL